jgi:Holliday junction resolvasome RuvABC endonuclease subunit
MTTILTLDLGTTTGWAVSMDGTVISGTQSFQNDRYSGGGMRFLRFTKWLEEIQALNQGIDEVYFEEVRRHSGTCAAHIYGGFMAHLTAWCESYKIPYEGVPVGTIKRHIAGKGNASKEDVIKAIQQKGHCPKDDNEADALALLYWRLDR